MNEFINASIEVQTIIIAVYGLVIIGGLFIIINELLTKKSRS